MKIAVLSYLATYGNAPLLCRGLAELGHDVRLVLRYKNAAGQDDYGFDEQFPNLKAEAADELEQARRFAAEAEKFVVMGVPSLEWLLPRVTEPSVAARRGGAVVISSTHMLFGLRQRRKEFSAAGVDPVRHNNELIAASGLRPLVMPDLLDYVTASDALPYYHPTALPTEVRREPGIVHLGHSPGKNGRRAWKGTDTVERAFRAAREKFGQRVRCTVIEGLPHAACLRIKRTIDIFVDQMHPGAEVPGWPDYLGGLGKSGLEAMAAGAAVITSGRLASCMPHFPESPVLAFYPCVVTADYLTQMLAWLIERPDATALLGEEGRRWIKENCLPQTIARRVVEAMR